MKPANAAIYYDPDGYDTTRKKLVGRHAAGEGFLLGFARHSGVERFYCYADSKRYLNLFTEAVQDCQPGAAVTWVPRGRLAGLGEVGCLFVPGPNIGKFAWRRRSVGDHAYSLCGVTHTTATHAIMDAFAGFLTDPAQPWDAVVCTSSVVRDTAEKVTGAYADYLKRDLGARRLTLPRFPVIPLGVECDRFSFHADLRGKWRQRLGIKPEDIVYLFMGRLSFFEKAHPLPMYLALEKAAQRSKRRLHLIQAGWFPNDGVEQEFREGAKTLCPSVNAIFLDGRDPAVRWQIWAAADVFTSLSDNIQETFGLTPIEAMASGLPVVVSDWNGYKDTVRDSVDGFRVPTTMPEASMGVDLANRYADTFDSYGRYCGNTSQLVAIDTEKCAEAYARLAEDAEGRKKMGAAGKKRARETYDWSVVVAQYQELWAELAELRRAAAKGQSKKAKAPPTDPTRLDPFEIFASYPTRVLTPDDQISMAKGATKETFQDRLRYNMVTFTRDVLPRKSDCLTVLDHLAEVGSCSARELTLLVAPEHRRKLYRGLVWLHKIDILHIAPGP